MTSAMPSIFLSHGSPMLALEDAPTTHFLRALARDIPRPRAILVASAHWEAQVPSLSGAATPGIIHDFRGFPHALYQLNYPAPGDPALAAKAQSLLKHAGFDAVLDPLWKWDHGVWNPLLLMYPQADIPVVELSVQPAKDAAHHYRVGQALKPLRDEGVLILGSGNLTHNLHEAMRGNHADTPAWVSEFAEWVAGKVAAGDIDSLLQWDTLGPHGLRNHPTPEHFLPFVVALGAGGVPLTPKRLHDETAFGVLAMDSYGFY